jgi:hypothetical protein
LKTPVSKPLVAMLPAMPARSAPAKIIPRVRTIQTDAELHHPIRMLISRVRRVTE